MCAGACAWNGVYKPGGVDRSGAWQAWRERVRGMSQFARNLVPKRCLGRKSEPSWGLGPNLPPNLAPKLAPPALCREADARALLAPMVDATVRPLR